ncbi:MAG: hypothetical protein CMJ58_05670 [Planctomycetaceae bacterium]|nr:hypothetical protein [Planctomycetaceae bacterium]
MPASATPSPRAAASASSAWTVAAVSFCVLALELALIRLIPAEVKAVSYFTNLILIASFFGLGLGCILQNGPRLAWLLPAGLAAVAAFVYFARGIVVYEAAGAVHYWLQDRPASSETPQMSLFVSGLLAFLASALPFVAMGQELARRMDQFPRLTAYSWDIAGSIAGTVAAAACAYLAAPPWAWPMLVAVIWSFVIARSWVLRTATLATGAAFLMFAASAHPSAWSPYYLVQHEREPEGLRVWVNSSFHQFALDMDRDDLPLVQNTAQRFAIPYDRYRDHHGGQSPRRVLILGAGTGNDVNVALANGAERVVAVEIDPAIYDLGRRLNPTRPYDDPRVEVRLDDARHYLHTSPERFDLIVFATLDSQTLLSGAANLRLENYVYTTESFRDARALLADDGMVGLYYSVMKPWLYGRIVSTVLDAFGERIEFMRTHVPFLFNTIIVAGPNIDGFGGDAQLAEELGGYRVNTDDWPYLYLQEPTIAAVYWKLFAAVAGLIVVALVLLRLTTPATGWHANFLLLGAGFTLLESAAIVRLALWFGSTWVVNAVVFTAALGTIFLANLAVMKNRAPSLRAAWLGLFAALAVNYLFPLQALFAYPAAVRTIAAALLAGTPVFFAAVCFSRLFQREESTGYPLGINLIGAMGGAMLEYSSMVLGMRDVWLVLIAVYAGALLASGKALAAGRAPAGAPLPGKLQLGGA